MSNSRRLFLGRRTNGRYILGMLCPVRKPILGSDTEELWPEHGDPMTAEICSFAGERLLGRRLEPLDVTQVVVSFTEIPGPGTYT